MVEWNPHANGNAAARTLPGMWRDVSNRRPLPAPVAPLRPFASPVKPNKGPQHEQHQHRHATQGWRMRFAAVLCAAALTACSSAADSAQPVTLTEPNPTTTMTPTTTSTTSTTLPPTTSTTTTAPPLVPPGTPCEEWADEAVAGGWPNDPHLLTELLSEAYQESRCLPIGPAKAYPNFWPVDYSKHFNGHDFGIMQINVIHRAYASDLFGSMEALVDPVANFNMAWRLYSELEAQGRCGFKPWSRPCR